MKVLIITYYWPNAGGSGVQRWLKFVKYLQGFGIEPIVYTVDNANYEVIDKSLANEIPKEITVLKQPIFEPNNFIKSKKVATSRVSSKPSLIQRTMQYIRGNFFIPDARKYWVKPSVDYLTTYLKKNAVDIVITTGPPHSMHLIGMKLKRKIGVKWIADFRDPMSNLFYNKELLLTEKSKNKLQQLEKQILTTADKVITVSNHIAEDFKKSGVGVEVISNGYDDEVLASKNIILDTKFTLSHIGLLPTQSNPKVLWKVLQELVAENESFSSDLQVNLVGNVSGKVLEDISKLGLENQLILTKNVHHSKAIQLQKKSQVLLLLIPQVEGAKGIVTGKIFEYLVSGRPILAIAPTDGDVSKIISDTKTGTVIDFEDEVQLKTTILELYKQYKEGSLKVEPENVEKYHRKKLTEKLAQIITNL
ncbi:MAG: glycosyl transferase family 1 [Lutibacter sp.]|nr:MAG: glycosyl transferase family 1 [Lutibacter sp.]